MKPAIQGMIQNHVAPFLNFRNQYQKSQENVLSDGSHTSILCYLYIEDLITPHYWLYSSELCIRIFHHDFDQLDNVSYEVQCFELFWLYHFRVTSGM